MAEKPRAVEEEISFEMEQDEDYEDEGEPG